MEFEFDKEIDAILRQARLSGEAATSTETHLGADEISAFAENAVPGAARARLTAHLADCTRCRKILSNVILMNAEADTETASSAVAAADTAEAKTPWYRKLFVFPQLAYTMGALVLLFSGFFGYLLLKNLPGSGSSQVAYSTNSADRMDKSASESAPQAVSNSNSAVNSSIPSTASTPANTASTTANSAPVLSSNTTTTAAATPAPLGDKTAEPELNSREMQNLPSATPLPKPQSQPTVTTESDEVAKVSPAAPVAGAVTQNRAAEEKKKNETADAVRPKDDDNKSLSAQKDSQMRSAPMTKTARKQESEAGATRSVGGKTFNNVGGIWFDSMVGKQKPKTIRRGTSDYLKLDAGLRSIADQLGGTVVVLWSGKAYRIQ
jgi:hypothetical protein